MGQTSLQLTDRLSIPKILLYCDGITIAGDKNVLKLDASTGSVRFGGNGHPGSLMLYPGLSSLFDGNESSITLNGHTGLLQLGPSKKVGPNGIAGKIVIRDTNGNNAILLDGNPQGSNSISVRDTTQSKNVLACSFTSNLAGLYIGAPKVESGGKKAGKVVLRDQNGSDSVQINGDSGSILLSAYRDFGDKLLSSIDLNAKNSALTIRKIDPSMDQKHFPRIDLSAESGNVSLVNNNGNESILLSAPQAVAWLGCKDNDGDLLLFSKNATNFRDTAQASIQLNGGTGDITLRNADCAEEFDISLDSTEVEPGTVMVIDNDGKLLRSNKAYDKRVAGVVSGANDYKPGIILDKKKTQRGTRVPISLVGKVNCKVNADYSPIKVGDMLTTSATPGHAMKATNRSKAFGAIIGKALRTLKLGKSMIPILIALQ